MALLEILVAPGCHGCERAERLAGEIALSRPGIAVRLIDLSNEAEAGRPPSFAVPAYLYNGRMIFLGNPSSRELEAKLDRLDSKGG